MYPRQFAKSSPDKLAVIVKPSGQSLTYAELENRANQVAQTFRAMGLKAGDKVAFVLENCADVYPFVWGAQRSGLYYIAISSRLKADEIAYIVQDSGSQLLLGSTYIGEDVLNGLNERLDGVHLFIKDDVSLEGWKDWASTVDEHSTDPIADEGRGGDMLYSSGTTGRPKGIVATVDHSEAPDTPQPLVVMAKGMFGIDENANYLNPAPLYHAAPLRWTMWSQCLGATIVVMEKYDPEHALQLMEEHKITHAQFVPTHFVRMLKMDKSIRSKYDVSSLQLALHAAAPCPVPVKQEMIEWWGPKLVEYYAGSEGNGMTMVSSADWVTHPGTVGRAVVGELKICNPEGDEVPTGEEGLIHFANGNAFTYHNDPDKTADATNKHGWTTLGDIGKVDEEGFLYLTDRKSFMIISGGVNIYPQEIENLIITHPKVADVAVIGGPDPDFGEKVIAVVQPQSMDDATPEFAQELEQFCRQSLSGVKIPRQIDFRAELPRADTGKLYKRLIRDEYWSKAG